MAVMYVTQLDFRKADAWFQKALQRYPDDPAVHFERSIALLHQDRADEAQQHAAKAAQLGLDSATFLTHRGLIAMRLQQYERAAEYFRFVLDRMPQHTGALTSLALALAEQDDVAQRKRALELLKSATPAQRNSPLARSVLGRVQFRNGQLDAAEETLTAVAARMPSERSTLFFLATVLMQQGKQDEARRVAQRLDPLIDQPGVFVFRPAARKWVDTVLGKAE